MCHVYFHALARGEFRCRRSISFLILSLSTTIKYRVFASSRKYKVPTYSALYPAKAGDGRWNRGFHPSVSDITFNPIIFPLYKVNKVQLCEKNSGGPPPVRMCGISRLSRKCCTVFSTALLFPVRGNIWDWSLSTHPTIGMIWTWHRCFEFVIISKTVQRMTRRLPYMIHLLYLRSIFSVILSWHIFIMSAQNVCCSSSRCAIFLKWLSFLLT